MKFRFCVRIRFGFFFSCEESDMTLRERYFVPLRDSFLIAPKKLFFSVRRYIFVRPTIPCLDGAGRDLYGVHITVS